MAPESTT